VCNNQGDDKKEHQVAFMGGVYGTALHVLCYQGLRSLTADPSNMHQRYLEFQNLASVKTNADSGERQNDAPDEEELNAKSYLDPRPRPILDLEVSYMSR